MAFAVYAGLMGRVVMVCVCAGGIYIDDFDNTHRMNKQIYKLLPSYINQIKEIRNTQTTNSPPSC